MVDVRIHEANYSRELGNYTNQTGAMSIPHGSAVKRHDPTKKLPRLPKPLSEWRQKPNLDE